LFPAAGSPFLSFAVELPQASGYRVLEADARRRFCYHLFLCGFSIAKETMTRALRRSPLGMSKASDIPHAIWALGFVSLLMDVSSEMIHALLPIYLVTVLGASMASVGIIEGIAEATASISKIFSGAISDWLGKRKLLAVLGYGLAALTKPIFPLASSLGWVVAARFIDRLGKGIRGAPRDALIADIAPPNLRGASFGLRQSLDTIGAFVGPLIAVGLMALTANHFRTVFWVAVIPAFLAVALLVYKVQEPERPPAERNVGFPLSLPELRRLKPAYWLVVGVATLFTLARFSEAFLILRAQAAGLPIALAPTVLVVMNFVYALAAYPAGVLSDRLNRMSLLIVGFALLIVADLILAVSSGLFGIGLGIVFWGLHLGFTQGLLATLVADTAPEELRGTAFGVFNLLGGLALLAASVVAGLLWDKLGPQATFLAGAGFTAISLLGLALVRWRAPDVGVSPVE
jgi:MFS family permease